jgi:phosphate-selective porin
MVSAVNTFSQGCDEPSEGEEDEAIKFFGFFQPQYEYHMTSPASNTFKFKRARIGIRGDIPYDFSYYIVMENSSFVSQTGSPYLLDAFLTYKRFKWATVSVGSFKQPFGMEVNTACHSLHTIERSIVSDQIVAPQRDMGLMLLSGNKETKFRYSLALMNGRG